MRQAQGKASRVAAVERQGGRVAQMQRRRLLLAMSEVVGEQGLHEATVGAVCKRAGMSRRTFYEIFEDREACLLAAVDDAARRLERVVAPVYGGEGRWGDRVRNAIAVLLDLFDAEPALARMCFVETLRAGPAVLERRVQVMAVAAAVVDEGRAEVKRGSTPPPLTAQGVVGGALSVIHARLLEDHSAKLAELAGPLMAMIVYPYLGPVAAERELARQAPNGRRIEPVPSQDPFKDLPIRFTYRTARVLAVIAEAPGASNRHIADCAGVGDYGQMSRLLHRLASSGLIENEGEGHLRGEPNAWVLTQRGQAVQLVLAPS